MLLSQKVQAIEEVISLLDQEMSKFRGWSGLSCKIGCGKCCDKPDIEATVLEFLPFAYHIYHLNQSVEWLARLDGVSVEVLIEEFGVARRGTLELKSATQKGTS